MTKKTINQTTPALCSTACGPTLSLALFAQEQRSLPPDDALNGISDPQQSPTAISRMKGISPLATNNDWAHQIAMKARGLSFVQRVAGFTLIEVIVCSMVFLFIATALASVFQLGMVVDQDEQSINEIISSMIVSRRYLLEGAPKGSNVGDKGLLEADEALMTTSLEYLEEDLASNGSPLPVLEYRVGSERYRMWVASDTLYRHCVAPSILPRETVVGNSEANMKMTTLDGEPPFTGSRFPGFVMGTWRVYEDRNGNNRYDEEEKEPSLPFRFSAALRNVQ